SLLLKASNIRYYANKQTYIAKGKAASPSSNPATKNKGKGKARSAFTILSKAGGDPTTSSKSVRKRIATKSPIKKDKGDNITDLEGSESDNSSSDSSNILNYR
ncbi:hypothetical protein N7530_000648, partial [Penicillium desertorum]